MPDPVEEARRALEDHRAKVERELAPREGAEVEGVPAGDPGTGVLVALEPPATSGVLDALGRSLDSVGHPGARVVLSGEGLMREILSGGPVAIAAVGPGASRALDELEYPLAHARFSEQREGEWFVWSKGVRGLSLPALLPALEDEEAKRRFWRAFLALRALEPCG